MSLEEVAGFWVRVCQGGRDVEVVCFWSPLEVAPADAEDATLTPVVPHVATARRVCVQPGAEAVGRCGIERLIADRDAGARGPLILPAAADVLVRTAVAYSRGVARYAGTAVFNEAGDRPVPSRPLT